MANNENIDPTKTPNRQSSDSLASPAQTGMWDSNDPMRNPPPLPLSPKMLRVNPSVSRSSSPTSVGKLQLTNLNTSDIELQLHRVTDAQSSLKVLAQSIDTSVKQTQIDLESLVSRSTNNNTYLKDLFQSISESSNRSTNLSESNVEQLLTKALSPLNEKLSLFESAKDQVTSQLKLIKDHVEKDNDLKIEKQEIIARLDKFDSELKEQLNSQDIAANTENVLARLKDLEESMKSIRISSDSNYSQIEATISKLIKDSIEGNIRTQIESTTTQLVKANAKLEKLIPIDLSSLETATKKIQTSTSSHERELGNLNSKLTEANQNLHGELKKLSSQLGENTKDRSIIDSLSILYNNKHDEISENFRQHRELQESLNLNLNSHNDKIADLITTKLNSIDLSITQNVNELRYQNIELELSQKNSELELKNKEIADLKEKLKEQEQKESFQKSIIDLVQQNSKLEARYEALNEAYNLRYQDFKSLHEQHETLDEKLLNVNVDKLISIIGSATLSSISDNPTAKSKTENSSNSLSHPLSIHSNRVLSTNSYLSNTPIGTPKLIKKYELKPIEASDQEDKENCEV